ncbi:DUF4359 domain-containing protein [Rhodovulum tesquicola]|uniref:DUF4359 domain-containing protein n=1 Tax=Rhodovulum tesquicola TaxID=540254 RepID=UPI002097267E|nr:DUF4359 domain-containing protein [Rhodovulum tesquicola]MCO8145019.1 DUF4359 domain-containing protein [Rhodovulum tesquicola]
MKGLAGLIAVLALGALVMAFTKPTEADFEAALEARLLARIDAADPEAAADPVEAILLATCKLGRTQCAQLIRSLIALDYEDKVLFSRAEVRLGDTDSATCIGAFTRIFCTER